MDFSYFNKNNKQVKLNLQIGTKWNDLNIQNDSLNSIFTKIDDGDGIIQENEYHLMAKLCNICDQLVKNIANNKTLENKELTLLLEKINSKDINITNMQKEALYKVDYSDYTFEALKKRYPNKDYTITQENGEIKVLSKKLHNYVLIVCTSGDRLLVKNLAKDNYLWEERFYDNDGQIIWHRDENANEHYPIIENLHDAFKSNNQKEIFKFLNMISLSNIRIMYDQYNDTFKTDLMSDIEKLSDNRIKDKVKNYITNLLSKKYDYKNKPFVINNSQIKNSYYTGKSYSIKYDTDKITITDKSSNTSKVIDLNKLGKDLSFADKIELKSKLQKIPGEVLMDMAIEIDGFRSATTFDKIGKTGAGAFYTSKENVIVLRIKKGDNQIDKNTIVHELGHAIDFTGYIINSATSSSCSNFMQTFQKELDLYKKDGHNQSEGSGDFYSNLIEENYCTTNEKEMFAECYTLLMTGDCLSKSTIEKYFAQTLIAAKNMLNDIRKLSDYKRNSVI